MVILIVTIVTEKQCYVTLTFTVTLFSFSSSNLLAIEMEILLLFFLFSLQGTAVQSLLVHQHSNV